MSIPKKNILRKNNQIYLLILVIVAIIAISFTFESIIFAVKASSFNYVRGILITTILIIAFLIIKFKLMSVFYDKSKRSHIISRIALCFVCVIFTCWISSLFHTKTDVIPYPLENPVKDYSPYVQQFDAFQKGQVHLDVDPDPRLVELENPYDPAQRKGISYMWDRAYYNGNYYCYFMIAPIITVYYPHYVVFKSLPSDDVTMRIFTVMTALFFSLSVIKWADINAKRLPIPILYIVTISALFSTQVFLMSSYPIFYYIATVAGMAFTSLFTYLFICALAAKNKKVRNLLFISAGAAYSLVFLSRINMALLPAFAILPVIWFKIIKPNIKEKKTILTDLISLGVPIAFAGIFQMWFNYARFDSVFNFGAYYQLTVGDVSQYKMRITDIFLAAWHYFFQPLSAGNFPFYTMEKRGLFSSYSHFLYIDPNFGLLSIPFFWYLFGSISTFRKTAVTKEYKIILASILTGIFFIAWFNFCMAGVVFRYIGDLTIVAALVTAAIIFCICENAKYIRTVYISVTAICAISFFISFTLAFSPENDVMSYSPKVYEFIRDIFK